MTITTRLDRLTMLRATLMECKKDVVKNADEWQTYDSMMTRVNELLHDERKARGWSGVYPIENGCSGDCLFEGDPDQCRIYTDILLHAHPEMKGNIIITQLY